MAGRKWAEERKILLAILYGDETRVFERHNVSTLDQAHYRQMANQVVARIVRRNSPVRGYFTAPIRNPIRLGTVLAGVLATGAAAGAAWLMPYISLSDPRKFPVLNGFVGLCAVVAAALGWGVSGWVAHRTARAKQTLDIVSARFSQPAFGKALGDFNEGFVGRKIDTQLVASYATSGIDTERDALQGLRYVVNYFEFIAVGVLSGELDEAIVARTLRGNLKYVYDTCAVYIAEVQLGSPQTLENFTMLRRHYEEA